MPFPLLNVFIFAFTIWLGLYLIARDRTKPVLVYTGLGLVGYAIGLALYQLIQFDSAPVELQTVQAVFLFVPALCWFVGAIHILPEGTLSRPITLGVRYIIP